MKEKTTNSAATPPESFVELVAQKINDLRPRLLDLTSRNPLISLGFNARSASHVRVVDELPDELYFKLSTGGQMEFAPLPPIDEDTKDEQSPRFVEAYMLAYPLTEFAFASLHLLTSKIQQRGPYSRESCS